MARSIETIHKGMLDDIASNEVLTAYLNSTSLYAIYRNFTYIVAVAIALFEGFFDQHTWEIDTKIINQKSGRLAWYRFMALRFQYGYGIVLEQDKDYYNNGNATLAQIEASKIIKYAAVTEAVESSRVILKIAGETNGVLTPFTETAEIDAITKYINDIRIAGVKVTIINYPADRLFLNIVIKRDALLLDENGLSLGTNGGNYPVLEALQTFMKELPFDGELKLSALVDKLQVIAGVIDATVLSASSSWIDPLVSDYGIPQPIFINKVPVSGYFEIQDFTPDTATIHKITYVV